ncbi:MAG: hypothetical protein O3A00_27645 [Planctomycetota bacterium]|nr:hypothetical protein [Planctomycetota bacterium]
MARTIYTDKLPTIADADSHGDLKKWSSQLDLNRHVYIARSGSYADFLNAARNEWVVCVVTGVKGVSSGVSYYLCRPILDQKVGNLLEVGPIASDDRGIVFQRDRGNCQVHSTHATKTPFQLDMTFKRCPRERNYAKARGNLDRL